MAGRYPTASAAREAYKPFDRRHPSHASDLPETRRQLAERESASPIVTVVRREPPSWRAWATSRW